MPGIVLVSKNALVSTTFFSNIYVIHRYDLISQQKNDVLAPFDYAFFLLWLQGHDNILFFLLTSLLCYCLNKYFLSFLLILDFPKVLPQNSSQ